MCIYIYIYIHITKWRLVTRRDRNKWRDRNKMALGRRARLGEPDSESQSRRDRSKRDRRGPSGVLMLGYELLSVLFVTYYYYYHHYHYYY